MGIPAYFSDLVKKNPSIMKPITGKINTDILLFDGNSIIYDAYYSIKEDLYSKSNAYIVDKIISETKKRIKDTIRLFVTKKSIAFFLDGPPPLAKLKQQRERRYKTLIKSKVIKTSEPWNTCNISPGTDFMKQLDKELTKLFEFINKEIIECHYYGSNQFGEGEHKLFQWLRERYGVTCNDMEKLSTTKSKINDRICVVGLDSDLIMLSLLHYNIFDNIFLYRETPDFISSIHSSLNKTKLI